MIDHAAQVAGAAATITIDSASIRALMSEFRYRLPRTLSGEQRMYLDAYFRTLLEALGNAMQAPVVDITAPRRAIRIGRAPWVKNHLIPVGVRGRPVRWPCESIA